MQLLERHLQGSTVSFRKPHAFDVAVTNAAFFGTVGLDWQVNGFADFNHDGMTDLLLRNTSSGGFEVYNISNNSIINAAFLGTVGLYWRIGGDFGNFSSLGESDMILRNVSTGGLEVYDISNNQITRAAFMGTVGLDWRTIGVGNFSGNPGGSGGGEKWWLSTSACVPPSQGG